MKRMPKFSIPLRLLTVVCVGWIAVAGLRPAHASLPRVPNFAVQKEHTAILHDNSTPEGSLLPIAFGPGAARQATDLAGNRMQPLIVPSAQDGSTRHCTTDGDWCVAIEEEDGALVAVLDARNTGAATRIKLPYLPDYGGVDHSTTAIWPFMIQMTGGGSLFGITRADHTAYSGGGAFVSTLALYRALPDETPQLVAELDWHSSEMIRACFSEQDYRDRRGACHDGYRFSANLTLDKDGEPDAPVLRYRVISTSFPGRVSRSGSEVRARRLRKRDLVDVTDPTCSFSRKLQFDRATGAYKLDAPLPDCSDFRSL